MCSQVLYCASFENFEYCKPLYHTENIHEKWLTKVLYLYIHVHEPECCTCVIGKWIKHANSLLFLTLGLEIKEYTFHII